MGRRGPPPRPTKLRLLDGNPSRRAINEREPQPEVKAPDCPPWLDPEARAEWARVVPELLILGILGRIDRADLAGYCATWSSWRSVYLTIRELGRTFTTPSGYVGSRPEVVQEAKLLALLRVYAADFGMTPAARSKVAAVAKPEDTLDALLG